jgi:hypothetical protein
MIRIVEHPDQIVHDLGHQEMIEELTAPITYVGALMPKSFANRRESVEPIAQQGTMSTLGVMRDRQHPHEGLVLLAHFSLQRSVKRAVPCRAQRG